MRRTLLISYIIIFITLIGTLSLSRVASDKMRGQSVAFLAPLWDKLLGFKDFLSDPKGTHLQEILSMEKQLHSLQLEKQLVLNELSDLYQKIEIFHQLDSQKARISHLTQSDQDFFSREETKVLQRLLPLVKFQFQAMPASILFRSLDQWNSAFWINIGSENNQGLDETAIGKNSPVVIGDALLGVVDYVGKYQSRVRLITDPRVNPSVRVVRGGEQDRQLHQQIEDLIRILRNKRSKNAYFDQLQEVLHHFKDELAPSKNSLYLAKGIMVGCDTKYSKSGKLILKGTCFNYDFPDKEGSGRDLRTGKSYDPRISDEIPIIKSNDLLVTTGFDGVFPPNLKVGIVTKVNLLKEGDYFYELSAIPSIQNFDELRHVLVLPPYSAEEIPIKVNSSRPEA